MATKNNKKQVGVASVSNEMVGRSTGTLPDPTGKLRTHVELVSIDVKSRPYRVTFEHRAYWENCFVVYDCTGPSPAEYMRFGKYPHNVQNTDRLLQPGHQYVFSAWHLEGPGGPADEKKAWTPSHTRLLVTDDYTVLVDDGKAGTGEGDFSFDDMKAWVRPA